MHALAAIGGMAAAALRAFDGAGGGRRGESLLTHVAEVLSRRDASWTLSHFSQEVMRVVEKVLRCERSSLFLVDAQARVLYAAWSEGREGKRIEVSMHDGLIGRAVVRRAAVRVADAYDDPQFNRSFDEASGFRTRAVLCIPLFDRRGEVLGVLEVINKKALVGGAGGAYDVVAADVAGVTFSAQLSDDYTPGFEKEGINLQLTGIVKDWGPLQQVVFITIGAADLPLFVETAQAYGFLDGYTQYVFADTAADCVDD